MYITQFFTFAVTYAYILMFDTPSGIIFAFIITFALMWTYASVAFSQVSAIWIRNLTVITSLNAGK